jgi:two component transcriptional regulator, winged helix family
MRVLLVEDDEMIGANLQQALEAAGWSVDWVRDGVFASNAWQEGGYTCVLLDLGLPREDGINVLRRARTRGDMTPVLVLTARDTVQQRIQGWTVAPMTTYSNPLICKRFWRVCEPSPDAATVRRTPCWATATCSSI